MMGAVMKRATGKAMTILALSAALGLSGCASSGMNTAATVDGRVITESGMQAALAQLAPVAQVTPEQFLSTMIQAPVLEQKAVGQPFEMGTDKVVNEIREQFDIQDPDPLLVEFVRANYYGQNLTQAGIAITPADLQGLDVAVNPRYGTWDPAKATLSTQNPPWIGGDQATSTDS